ncbi:hypothetical protein J5U21_02018 [Saccharolobus shibatae]|uniref:Uncharacterized protein n=1 Tax=Saccharolobus shibatae TaxID=2286 RepID=A0A8F5BVS8_9CREN|nr:hypothetical protein J5U21_02018 [Saccharolobus shibatae]
MELERTIRFLRKFMCKGYEIYVRVTEMDLVTLAQLILLILRNLNFKPRNALWIGSELYKKFIHYPVKYYLWERVSTRGIGTNTTRTS